MRSDLAPMWFSRPEEPEWRKPVKIKVAWIGKTKEPSIQALTDEYLKRISHYADAAGVAVKDEAAILSLAGERQPRQSQKKERHKLVLLDSREAAFLGRAGRISPGRAAQCAAAAVRDWRERRLQ